MPARLVKLKNGKYRVYWGGKVVAKETTLKNAKEQIRLLGAKKHGWKPDKKK